MQFHPRLHIPSSTASSTILVYLTHCILSLMHHWSVVDPSLIHCWSIVDSLLIHCWSIVDLTCSHIFVWDNSWKASILDCNKITFMYCECPISKNMTRPCSFILFFAFHVVLQVAHFLVFDTLHIISVVRKGASGHFHYKLREEKVPQAIFQVSVWVEHSAYSKSWKKSAAGAIFLVSPCGWDYCQYGEIKPDLRLVSYVYFDRSLKYLLTSLIHWLN